MKIQLGQEWPGPPRAKPGGDDVLTCGPNMRQQDQPQTTGQEIHLYRASTANVQECVGGSYLIQGCNNIATCQESLNDPLVEVN